MNSILLIDDEAAIRNALCGSLQSFGYRVRTAQTIEAAQRATRQERFDVIVLEYNVRSKARTYSRTGNGPLFVRRLRHRGTASRILIYTSMIGEPYRASSLQAGADNFLSRDSGILDLVSCLATMTRSAKPTRTHINPLATCE